MIRALVKLDLWQGAILPHPGRIKGPKSPGEIGLRTTFKNKTEQELLYSFSEEQVVAKKLFLKACVQ